MSTSAIAPEVPPVIIHTVAAASRLAVTCGEEAVRRQEELRRNHHLVLGQFEDGEVLLLPLVVRNTALRAIIG